MRTFLLSTLVAAVVVLGSQPAQAQEVCPGNMAPTIAALADCVNHAISIGHIDNAGIGNSLLETGCSPERAESRQEFCRDFASGIVHS